MNVLVDANTGGLLQQYSDFAKEGVIGKGQGAYGDLKKISLTPFAGHFIADDTLRPADITTYDMNGNLARTEGVLYRTIAPSTADVASSPTLDWTDSTVVDAHAYAGWYYDFLYKRFGRNGIDNQNLRMAILTHPVRIADIRSATPDVLGTYYLNAFMCPTCGPNGRGAVVFGEGAPRGTYSSTVDVKPFSAALDVVAHELTHGVTAVTARLNGFPYSEAGALNEGFSDMFGVAAAFYSLPAGPAAMQASYFEGRDLTVPAGVFGRSIANPRSTGDPDHYRLRWIGGDPHYNSLIASHAFYLAIEGGTNRTSGLGVQGVGAANRDQIEKVFFRALTSLLPSSATFALARLTTIQSARDLYGAGSAAERAVTQAWDAVGVQPRTTATVAILPNPALVSNDPTCPIAQPNWVVGITLSAGSSPLRITQWAFDFFDHTGGLQQHDALSSAAFASYFDYCGPATNRVAAQTDACAAVCVNLDGDGSGTVQVSFTAVDDAGRTVTVGPARASLVSR